jgi:PAS domain S-box-containing protein
VVPLLSKGKGVFGVLVAGNCGTARKWNNDEIRILRNAGEMIIGNIERQKTEDDRKINNNRYEELVEMLPLSIFEMDLDGNIKSVNGYGLSEFGYEQEDIDNGLNIKRIFPPEELKKIFHNLMGIAIGEPYPRGREYKAISKDGSIFPVLIFTNIVEKDGNPVGFRVTMLNISERKKDEEELKADLEKFRALMENAPFGLFLVDESGNYTYANKLACSTLGFSMGEICKMNVTDLSVCEEEEARRVFQEFLKKGSMLEETNLRTRGGTKVPVLLTAVAIPHYGHMMFCVDISERKQIEEMLRQSQKMESIGKLAGGVAHDFNNILAAILGNADFMLLGKHDDETMECLNEIKKASKIGSELTQKLLAFARKGKTVVEATYLDDIVDDLIPLLKRTIDESIEIETFYQGEPYSVDVDVSQIQQVIMNLCVNSFDAIRAKIRNRSKAPAESDDGDVQLALSISTENVTLDAEYCSGHVDLKPGQYVKMSISDTGCGIDKETQLHMFDPFYTTKRNSLIQGTGLGLAMVYGIVKNHNGAIIVDSKVGKGTTLIIYLPRGERKRETKPPSNREVISGEGTILVVDDSVSVLRATEKMLRSMGYEVLVAEGGAEGIEQYNQHHAEIDGVILDMKMPDTGGMEVFRQMRQIEPDVRVILTTGYGGDNDQAQEILDKGAISFLPKPCSIEEMGEKVSGLIRGRKK